MRWPLPWPKSWRREKSPEERGAEDRGEERPKTLRENVILFARDLAIAFLIVGLIFGVMTAYTRVWPPVVVVESDSMQHSGVSSDFGVIDTGDIVLVQAVGTASDVTTYVQGAASGYETYSNFGDVIVFHAPGSSLSATPIIHRAMLFVVWNATGGADAPSLLAYPGGWSGELAAGGSTTTSPYGLSSITLHGVRSWFQRPQLQDVSWAGLENVRNDGFLTKGDHNNNGDGWGGVPVAVTRIVGKARGELPWFGLIKLTVSPGPTGCCDGWGDPSAPKNSWDALLISLVLILIGPFLADYGWGLFSGWWKKRRGVPAKDGNQDSAPSEEATSVPPPDPSPPPAGTSPPNPTENGASGEEPAGPTTDEDRTGSAGPGAGGP